MKNFSKSILAIVMVFVLTVGVMFVSSVFTSVQVTAEEKVEERNTIGVSGSYTVRVSPNIAYITVGINTFAVNPKDAQNENKAKMDGVFNKLVELGIEDKDIQTTNYSINPRYEWKDIEEKNTEGMVIRRNERILVGYDVNNTIKITVRDLAKTGDVIDITVDEGVNRANQVAFGISDDVKSEKYLEALKGAVENAKAKADTIASVYGVELGVPFNITEGSSYIPSPIYRNYDSVAKVSVAAEESVSTPISAGEMEISANVSVLYKY